jgi:hypothetical protein
MNAAACVIASGTCPSTSTRRSIISPSDTPSRSPTFSSNSARDSYGENEYTMTGSLPPTSSSATSRLLVVTTNRLLSLNRQRSSRSSLSPVFHSVPVCAIRRGRARCPEPSAILRSPPLLANDIQVHTRLREGCRVYALATFLCPFSPPAYLRLTRLRR